jgi:hypothetical protein
MGGTPGVCIGQVCRSVRRAAGGMESCAASQGPRLSSHIGITDSFAP